VPLCHGITSSREGEDNPCEVLIKNRDDNARYLFFAQISDTMLTRAGSSEASIDRKVATRKTGRSCRTAVEVTTAVLSLYLPNYQQGFRFCNDKRVCVKGKLYVTSTSSKPFATTSDAIELRNRLTVSSYKLLEHECQTYHIWYISNMLLWNTAAGFSFSGKALPEASDCHTPRFQCCAFSSSGLHDIHL
jgi:hypothetical protein